MPSFYRVWNAPTAAQPPHLPGKRPTLAWPIRDPGSAGHRSPSRDHCLGAWRNACPLLPGGSEFPMLLLAPLSPGAMWAPRWRVGRVGAALHTWPKRVSPGPRRSPSLRQPPRLPPPPRLALAQIPAVCEPQLGWGLSSRPVGGACLFSHMGVAEEVAVPSPLSPPCIPSPPPSPEERRPGGQRTGSDEPPGSPCECSPLPA